MAHYLTDDEKSLTDDEKSSENMPNETKSEIIERMNKHSRAELELKVTNNILEYGEKEYNLDFHEIMSHIKTVSTEDLVFFLTDFHYMEEKIELSKNILLKTLIISLYNDIKAGVVLTQNIILNLKVVEPKVAEIWDEVIDGFYCYRILGKDADLSPYDYDVNDKFSDFSITPSPTKSSKYREDMITSSPAKTAENKAKDEVNTHSPPKTADKSKPKVNTPSPVKVADNERKPKVNTPSPAEVADDDNDRKPKVNTPSPAKVAANERKPKVNTPSPTKAAENEIKVEVANNNSLSVTPSKRISNFDNSSSTSPGKITSFRSELRDKMEEYFSRTSGNTPKKKQDRTKPSDLDCNYKKLIKFSDLPPIGRLESCTTLEKLNRGKYNPDKHWTFYFVRLLNEYQAKSQKSIFSNLLATIGIVIQNKKFKFNKINNPYNGVERDDCLKELCEKLQRFSMQNRVNSFEDLNNASVNFRNKLSNLPEISVDLVEEITNTCSSMNSSLETLSTTYDETNINNCNTQSNSNTKQGPSDRTKVPLQHTNEGTSVRPEVSLPNTNEGPSIKPNVPLQNTNQGPSIGQKVPLQNTNQGPSIGQKVPLKNTNQGPSIEQKVALQNTNPSIGQKVPLKTKDPSSLTKKCNENNNSSAESQQLEMVKKTPYSWPTPIASDKPPQTISSNVRPLQIPRVKHDQLGNPLCKKSISDRPLKVTNVDNLNPEPSSLSSISSSARPLQITRIPNPNAVPIIDIADGPLQITQLLNPNSGFSFLSSPDKMLFTETKEANTNKVPTHTSVEVKKLKPTATFVVKPPPLAKEESNKINDESSSEDEQSIEISKASATSKSSTAWRKKDKKKKKGKKKR